MNGMAPMGADAALPPLLPPGAVNYQGWDGNGGGIVPLGRRQ